MRLLLLVMGFRRADTCTHRNPCASKLATLLTTIKTRSYFEWCSMNGGRVGWPRQTGARYQVVEGSPGFTVSTVHFGEAAQLMGFNSAAAVLLLLVDVATITSIVVVSIFAGGANYPPPPAALIHIKPTMSYNHRNVVWPDVRQFPNAAAAAATLPPWREAGQPSPSMNKNALTSYSCSGCGKSGCSRASPFYGSCGPYLPARSCVATMTAVYTYTYLHNRITYASCNPTLSWQSDCAGPGVMLNLVLLVLHIHGC
jgi:hypothetical protein